MDKDHQPVKILQQTVTALQTHQAAETTAPKNEKSIKKIIMKNKTKED